MSKRCQICRKKLDLADQLVGACECGGSFCRKHSRPINHDCKLKDDIGANFRKKLENNMVKVEAPKMQKI